MNQLKNVRTVIKEAELEQEFIRMLCEQGYEYLSIHTENDLILNLRNKLEELNDYHFSDTEIQEWRNNDNQNQIPYKPKVKTARNNK